MKALAIVLFTLVICVNWQTTSATTHLTRPFVISDLVLNSGAMAFYTRSDGNVFLSQQATDDQPWSPWMSLGPGGAIGQGVKIISSPVGVHTSNNQTRIFAMASNGQVYSILQNPQPPKSNIRVKLSNVKNSHSAKENVSPSFGKWMLVGNSSLPFNAGVVLNGLDSVQVGIWKKQTILVFARSMTTGPNLYWCKGEETGSFEAWSRIGGSKPHLATDATVIYNPFSGHYEAFAVANDTDGKLQRAWQKNADAWSDWGSMGITSPDFSKLSRPTANSLSPDFFNGALEVFGIGRDGHIHHMFQTTCDHVDNPWGYCTWGVWHTTDSQTPGRDNWANAIMAGNNIHQGNEVFSLDQNGQVWHIYQLARGDSWSKWIQVTGLTPADKIVSLPYVTRNPQQWWRIYAVTAENKMIMVEQNRTIAAKPSKAAFGTDVTVSWSVPKDEATHQDWIGVYPRGTTDDKYVDFRYVQGTQNPRKDPVPTGSLQMNMYLTDGSYDVRYLVNKQFVNVVNTVLDSYNGTRDTEWLQLYHGIFIGLGAKSTNVEQCVEDGETTLETFKKSFEAFENREVFNGLKLFGTALEDVQKTLEKCLETDIAKAVEKFIKDLISCTESKCEKFGIDMIDFLLIMYEDVYEIYGDIYAASNSFNLIEAYQQGGLCIGRVVQACITLPA